MSKTFTVWLVTSFNFCKGLLFYQPIWSLYVLSELNSPYMLTGLLAIQSISTIIFEVPSGAAADLFGRKNCLTISILLSILSMLLFAYGGGFWNLLLAVVINSFAESMQSGTDVAIIFDSLKEANQADTFSRAVAINSSMWPMGALLGSIIGGFIATHSFRQVSFHIFSNFSRTAFSATLIPFSFCFFLALLIKEPKYEKEDHNVLAQIISSLKTVRNNSQILLILASGLLFFAFGELDHQMKPIFFQSHGLPLAYFGAFTAVSFGSSFLGSFYFSDWVRHGIFVS